MTECNGIIWGDEIKVKTLNLSAAQMAEMGVHEGEIFSIGNESQLYIALLRSEDDHSA